MIWPRKQRPRKQWPRKWWPGKQWPRKPRIAGEDRDGVAGGVLKAGNERMVGGNYERLGDRRIRKITEK